MGKIKKKPKTKTKIKAVCPSCGSKLIKSGKRAGKRGRKQNYQCTKCNKKTINPINKPTDAKPEEPTEPTEPKPEEPHIEEKTSREASVKAPDNTTLFWNWVKDKQEFDVRDFVKENPIITKEHADKIVTYQVDIHRIQQTGATTFLVHQK